MKPQTREVVLQRLQVIVQHVLVGDCAEPPLIDVLLQPAVDGMILRLTQAVAGEELQRIEANYPADWWQAFRERWLPKWWLALAPVRYNSFELVANGLYPKLSLPNQYGSRVVLYKRESNGWYEE